ncbi:MAG: RIO1 family regulatory kinase/ATPase [Chloroflexota bacterium]
MDYLIEEDVMDTDVQENDVLENDGIVNDEVEVVLLVEDKLNDDLDGNLDPDRIDLDRIDQEWDDKWDAYLDQEWDEEIDDNLEEDWDDLEDVYYEKFRLDDGERRQEIRRQQTQRPQQRKKTAADDFVDQVDLGETFETTYTPARFEKVWLRDSLQPFYLEGVITDVLMLVKGGKEANVYLCRAHPSTDYELMAAKVYRPQQFRNLRNDSTYREGREILDSQRGGVVQRRDSREMRALKNKTEFGSQMLHQSWLGYEYNTLNRFYEMGASVPKPITHGENAILMEYVGSETMAAPTLESVTLEPEQVYPLFREVMRNIELMLKAEQIHGDLSGYNILYWEDDVTIIDFPQVTSAISNRNAYRIFHRDVTRVCQYFASQGKSADPDVLAADLWKRCIGVPPDRQIWDQPPEMV